MSELSNISKSSVPSSVQSANRHASISSTASSVKQHNQQTHTLSAPKSTNNSSLLIQKSLNNQLPASAIGRVHTSSSKQLQQLSQYKGIANLTCAGATNSSSSVNETRKASLIGEHTRGGNAIATKKPGHLQSSAASQATPASVNNPLSINTALASALAATLSSTSSPSSTTNTIKTSKNESKLSKEIKRLEALCESRTKELSMLKINLRDALISFDAVAAAFNYLANDVKKTNNNNLIF
jgi:hypothetical protein